MLNIIFIILDLLFAAWVVYAWRKHNRKPNPSQESKSLVMWFGLLLVIGSVIEVLSEVFTLIKGQSG